ncbi:MAG: PASTA domain-containing protein [Eggerthellaceae bacterium]|nr:PASTA domain-containing protein [Eggerthellaceae bacterium]
MRCPNCHSDNKDAAKFCIECGHPLHAGHGRPADDAAEPARDDEPAASPADVIGASLAEVRSLRDETPAGDAADVFAPLIADNARRSAGVGARPASRRASAQGEPAEPDEPAAAAEPASAADGDAPAGGAAAPAGDDLAAAAAAPDPALEFEFEFVEELPVAGLADAEGPDPVPVAADPQRETLAEVVHDMFPDGGDAQATADLTGLERLVDSSYVPPAYASRAGDTMELPAVGGAPGASARRYAAAPDPKEARRQARAQRKLDRQMAREQRRGSSSSPRRGRAALIAVVLIALVAAAAAAGTYYLQLWGGKVVPDVVGRTQADAAYILEDKGFAVKALPVKSDEVEGVVLLSTPNEGQRAEEGSEVIIYVSVSRSVPAVVGLPRADAEALLADEELQAVTWTEVKSNEPEGTVLSVTPEAGEKVKAITPVTVEVAVPFTVPDVDGLTRDQAVEALEAEGYVASVRSSYTEDAPEGTVLGTEPAAGSQLNSGSEVTLLVAKSRKAECVAYTQSYFQSSKYFTIGGKSYEVDASTLSVDYEGNDTVRYSISGIQYGSLFGIVVRNESEGWQTLTGTITWDNSGNVTASDPQVKRN